MDSVNPSKTCRQHFLMAKSLRRSFMRYSPGFHLLRFISTRSVRLGEALPSDSI